MSRYPSEGVRRFDQQFAETSYERDARKAVRLRRSMRLALRCLDAAEFVSPEARRLVTEARRVLRMALETEGE